MARRTHTVPPPGGPNPAAVPAAVHAVLLVLLVLLGPLGRFGPPAPGTPHAQDADPALPSATARAAVYAAGERHTPPAPAAHPPRDTAGAPLPPGRTRAPAADPPVSEQPAHRHGMRAPPSISGV